MFSSVSEECRESGLLFPAAAVETYEGTPLPRFLKNKIIPLPKSQQDQQKSLSS